MILSIEDNSKATKPLYFGVFIVVPKNKKTQRKSRYNQIKSNCCTITTNQTDIHRLHSIKLIQLDDNTKPENLVKSTVKSRIHKQALNLIKAN
jgi:hypothetical protein